MSRYYLNVFLFIGLVFQVAISVKIYTLKGLCTDYLVLSKAFNWELDNGPGTQRYSDLADGCTVVLPKDKHSCGLLVLYFLASMVTSANLEDLVQNPSKYVGTYCNTCVNLNAPHAYFDCIGFRFVHSYCPNMTTVNQCSCVCGGTMECKYKPDCLMRKLYTLNDDPSDFKYTFLQNIIARYIDSISPEKLINVINNINVQLDLVEDDPKFLLGFVQDSFQYGFSSFIQLIQTWSDLGTCRFTNQDVVYQATDGPTVFRLTPYDIGMSTQMVCYFCKQRSSLSVCHSTCNSANEVKTENVYYIDKDMKLKYIKPKKQLTFDEVLKKSSCDWETHPDTVSGLLSPQDTLYKLIDEGHGSTLRYDNHIPHLSMNCRYHDDYLICDVNCNIPDLTIVNPRCLRKQSLEPNCDGKTHTISNELEYSCGTDVDFYYTSAALSGKLSSNLDLSGQCRTAYMFWPDFERTLGLTDMRIIMCNFWGANFISLFYIAMIFHLMVVAFWICYKIVSHLYYGVIIMSHMFRGAHAYHVLQFNLTNGWLGLVFTCIYMTFMSFKFLCFVYVILNCGRKVRASALLGGSSYEDVWCNMTHCEMTRLVTLDYSGGLPAEAQYNLEDSEKINTHLMTITLSPLTGKLLGKIQRYTPDISFNTVYTCDCLEDASRSTLTSRIKEIYNRDEGQGSFYDWNDVKCKKGFRDVILIPTRDCCTGGFTTEAHCAWVGDTRCVAGLVWVDPINLNEGLSIYEMINADMMVEVKVQLKSYQGALYPMCTLDNIVLGGWPWAGEPCLEKTDADNCETRTGVKKVQRDMKCPVCHANGSPNEFPGEVGCLTACKKDEFGYTCMKHPVDSLPFNIEDCDKTAGSENYTRYTCPELTITDVIEPIYTIESIDGALVECIQDTCLGLNTRVIWSDVKNASKIKARVIDGYVTYKCKIKKCDFEDDITIKSLINIRGEQVELYNGIKLAVTMVNDIHPAKITKIVHYKGKFYEYDPYVLESCSSCTNNFYRSRPKHPCGDFLNLNKACYKVASVGQCSYSWEKPRASCDKDVSSLRVSRLECVQSNPGLVNIQYEGYIEGSTKKDIFDGYTSYPTVFCKSPVDYNGIVRMYLDMKNYTFTRWVSPCLVDGIKCIEAEVCTGCEIATMVYLDISMPRSCPISVYINSDEYKVLPNDGAVTINSRKEYFGTLNVTTGQQSCTLIVSYTVEPRYDTTMDWVEQAPANKDFLAGVGSIFNKLGSWIPSVGGIFNWIINLVMIVAAIVICALLIRFLMTLFMQRRAKHLELKIK